MKGIATLAVAMVAAGCGSAPPVVQCAGAPRAATGAATPALVGVSYGTQIEPIPLNTVVFSDTSVADVIAVQRIGALRTPANTVEVSAMLVNCTGTQVPLRVRTTFFDADQRATEPASIWKTVFVPPKGLAQYTEYSTSRERVAAYLIEIAPHAPQS